MATRIFNVKCGGHEYEGFGHIEWARGSRTYNREVVEIYEDGYEVSEGICKFLNRTWQRYDYEVALIDAVEKWLGKTRANELYNILEHSYGLQEAMNEFLCGGEVRESYAHKGKGVRRVPPKKEYDAEYGRAYRESYKRRGLKERNLTSYERYNRNADRIFKDFDARNERMAQFLKDYGVPDDEIAELKKHTGLGHNALDDKMNELGIRKDFFDIETANSRAERERADAEAKQKEMVKNLKWAKGFTTKEAKDWIKSHGSDEAKDVINKALYPNTNESLKEDISDNDMDIIGYEYGYYNDYPKDKEYFTNLYTKRGYKDVKVKRTRSDTRGLKAYEITGLKEGNSIGDKVFRLNGINLKDWYTSEYPDDELGYELNDNVDLRRCFSSLGKDPDIYDVMGVGDSIIRERVFAKIADVLGVDYDVIYYKWLGKD